MLKNGEKNINFFYKLPWLYWWSLQQKKCSIGNGKDENASPAPLMYIEFVLGRVH